MIEQAVDGGLSLSQVHRMIEAVQLHPDHEHELKLWAWAWKQSQLKPRRKVVFVPSIW